MAACTNTLAYYSGIDAVALGVGLKNVLHDLIDEHHVVSGIPSKVAVE